ncbi:RusA-like resolvase [Rhodococcus phage Trogglehumper]|uniref:RusA-like resolvase n=1 Tax=Rhodococcus phage Trogglehumper TaxID=3038381 RepID=A0AAF0GNN1_9CAUD|nr:RusA-like resolvase [Rhodococcus phage Trogglehumper]
MTRFNHFVIHGINPEPWKVGPVSTSRAGGKLTSYVAPDAELAGFQSSVQDVLSQHPLLRGLKEPLLKPPYQIRFFWWRQIIQYQGAKRMVTRQRVDQTNMQKACEDALQPQKKTKYREFFPGVIENDRHCQFSGGLIVEQEKDVYPVIAIEIASEISTTGQMVLPLNMMDETANAVVLAMQEGNFHDVRDGDLI